MPATFNMAWDDKEMLCSYHIHGNTTNHAKCKLETQSATTIYSWELLRHNNGSFINHLGEFRGSTIFDCMVKFNRHITLIRYYIKQSTSAESINMTTSILRRRLQYFSINI